jgi:hypothetical protein
MQHIHAKDDLFHRCDGDAAHDYSGAIVEGNARSAGTGRGSDAGE